MFPFNFGQRHTRGAHPPKKSVYLDIVIVIVIAIVSVIVIVIVILIANIGGWCTRVVGVTWVAWWPTTGATSDRSPGPPTLFQHSQNRNEPCPLLVQYPTFRQHCRLSICWFFFYFVVFGSFKIFNNIVRLVIIQPTMKVEPRWCCPNRRSSFKTSPQTKRHMS